MLKKTLLIIFLLLTIVVGILIYSFYINIDQLDQKIHNKLDQILLKNMANYDNATFIPGMVIGIWSPKKGNYIKAFGYADLATKREMQIEDKFRVGSNTKTFVVTVMLQLQDEGKLNIDDPLSKFDLNIYIPNASKITLRQLCNMTSGLFEYFDDEYVDETFKKNPYYQWTSEELVELAVKHPPYFEPGKGYHYSNTGYLLLGMVIEKITGNTVEEEVFNRIIKPLELNCTSFPKYDTGLPFPFAQGYVLEKDNKWKKLTTYSPTPMGAAGAIISNLKDMKKWVKAYTTGKVNLVKSQKDRLTFVDTDNQRYKFGLGIVETNGWFGYTGGTPDYNTAAYYLPSEEATVIVLVNAIFPEKDVANHLVKEITTIVFPENKAFILKGEK